MINTRLAPLILTATIVTLAGCGSGGASKSLTAAEPPLAAKPLTAAALVAKANSICRHVEGQRAAYSMSSVADIVRLGPMVAGLDQVAASELAALVPPPSLASDWKLIVATSRTVADDLAEAAEAFKANDTSEGARYVNESGPVQAHLFAIYKQDGFGGCEDKT